MLILFDIDATLLRTDAAGLKAMHDAGRQMFGEQFSMDGVEFSGRLDTLIFADLMSLNNVADGPAHHDRFRAAYGEFLRTRLSRQPTATLLPGVRDLVHRLSADQRVSIGLLTGNYPETGRMKVSAAGLDPDLFVVAAWGCDGASRRDLPVVAMTRHAEQFGRKVAGREVVIIGDTPHDIDCAKAHGCRSIGVATGAFSIDVLRDCGADLAVETLAEVDHILNWMLNHSTAEIR